MTEEDLKFFASQLRMPNGDFATNIAQKMNVGNKEINLNAFEALAIEQNDKILEVGMGNGFFVESILSKHASIVYAGADFSEAMIKEASELNKKFIEQGRASFKLSNANSLPFEENSFTKLVTVNTLYFWEDREKTLSEFKRVLVPNGMLVIGIRPKSSMDLYPFVKYGFTKYTKEEVVKLLEDNSFAVTNVIVKEEPIQEIFGQKVKVESLVICAEVKK